MSYQMELLIFFFYTSSSPESWFRCVLFCDLFDGLGFWLLGDLLPWLWVPGDLLPWLPLLGDLLFLDWFPPFLDPGLGDAFCPDLPVFGVALPPCVGDVRQSSGVSFPGVFLSVCGLPPNTGDLFTAWSSILGVGDCIFMFFKPFDSNGLSSLSSSVMVSGLGFWVSDIWFRDQSGLEVLGVPNEPRSSQPNPVSRSSSWLLCVGSNLRLEPVRTLSWLIWFCKSSSPEIRWKMSKSSNC